MRIAPLALAYRNAPTPQLLAAIERALLPTHIHPLAIDGALMQAAGVAWLAARSAGDAGCTPAALLAHVQGVVQTETARGRLAELARAAEAQVRRRARAAAYASCYA